MTLRQLIEQHIIDANLGFMEVGGAASLASIVGNRVSTPGCYLFSERSDASQNERINGVSQMVTELVNIVIIIKNVRDPRGQDADDQLNCYRSSISKVLLGKILSPEYTQIEYAGGKLVSFVNGVIVWNESYKTSHYITG